ncbi:MAG: M15 family metallopeptidase [Firmicutes bacterium]|nr:M15 family metallopeptidase [Bacillota bacterium]
MKYYLALILTLVIVVCVNFSDAQELFNYQEPEMDGHREAPPLDGVEGSNDVVPDGSIDAQAVNPPPGPGHENPKNHDHPDEPGDRDKKLVEDPAALLVVVNKEYSLPGDYVPPDLVEPNITFSFTEDLPKRLMRQEAAAALELLFEQAAAEEIQIAAVSGYRSYDRQKTIFTSRAQERGFEVANRTTAYPGQSEHQTGLAMDVSGASVGYGLVQSFGQTKEGIWLAQMAPDFGFIIRYPQGREEETGYSYEPWHLRYVGLGAAREITDRGLILEEYVAEMQPVEAREEEPGEIGPGSQASGRGENGGY